jgi:hypothetical protein
MPKIPSYPPIQEISDDDLMIIDDASRDYSTKSVTAAQLAAYFNATTVTSELYEKTITLDYDNLETLNGGNSTITYSDFGVTPTSALSIIDVTAYLEAGTVPFDATNELLIGLGSGLDFKQRTAIDHASLINSSSSVYVNRGGADFIIGNLQPTPLGTNFSIKFDGSGAVTQGNGTLKLKVLYRLLDFS